MKQDTWTDTATRVEFGTTGALGSPRAWLRRALDTAVIDDVTFQTGTITPHEISVAGIWYKKPEGYGIPITGTHRELFRWFAIPQAHQMHRPRNSVALVPAIGVCAAVPLAEVLHWIDVYREHGAAFTWWNMPQDRAVRARAEKPKRRQLDHARVYDMLEQGMKPIEIGRALDFPTPNIDYVAKKWRQGVPLRERKSFVDQTAMLDAARAGASAVELANRFSVSPAYVYSVLQKVPE